MLKLHQKGLKLHQSVLNLHQKVLKLHQRGGLYMRTLTPGTAQRNYAEAGFVLVCWGFCGLCLTWACDFFKRVSPTTSAAGVEAPPELQCKLSPSFISHQDSTCGPARDDFAIRHMLPQQM